MFHGGHNGFERFLFPWSGCRCDGVFGMTCVSLIFHAVLLCE